MEGVDGPCEVGQVPSDMEFCVAQTADVATAQPCNKGTEAAARDGLTESFDEQAGTVSAGGCVIEMRDP